MQPMSPGESGEERVFHRSTHLHGHHSEHGVILDASFHPLPNPDISCTAVKAVESGRKSSF